MRGVRRVFIRRKKNMAVTVKIKTMEMSTKRCKNDGRFMVPATKISKNRMVLAAKITMKSMKAASFFKDENRLAKDILPLPIIVEGISIVFPKANSKVSNNYIPYKVPERYER